MSTESKIFPVVEYSEIHLSGYVPKVCSVVADSRPLISLPFYDSIIHGPQIDLLSDEVESELILSEADVVLGIGSRHARPFLSTS